MNLCDRKGTGTERSKNLREQSGERKSKKSSAAERSAEREVAERARSGERISQKWERGAAKQPAPLRSNALHMSNRVSAEKIASYIFVLIVYSHKVQSDSTTVKQSI